MLGNLVKGLLWIITFLCDIITCPLFYIFQQPWRNLQDFKKSKAEAFVGYDKITYLGTTPRSPLHVELRSKNMDTMDKIFQYAILRNGFKRCLGSRQVLDMEDELQTSGKVFKKYVLGEYIWKTYSETDRLVLNFSKGLRWLGLEPTQRIAVLAETRAEWLIAAMAAFRQNLTMVTLYANLGEDAIIHGLKETEVEYVLTSHDQLPKFINVLPQTPNVKKIIYMEDPLTPTDTSGYREDVEIFAFCDVVQRGSRLKKGTSEPTADDIAIIMYTSGSTGIPKGVLLSHRNISAGMMLFCDVLNPVYPDDVYIGYLPLAHVFELMCEAICFLSGVPIGYSSPSTMIDSGSKIKLGSKGDATILKPTIMACVPLVLDTIYKRIQEKVNESDCVSKALVEFFYDYKLYWYLRGYQTPLTNMFVFNKMRRVVGGNVRLLATGGAPLAPNVHEFVRTTLCVTLLQGYGLTETAGSATVTLASDMSTGRVGPPLGCCSIRLINWEEGNYTVEDKPYPRGEILIGGDHVSEGYFKLPDATEADFFEEKGRRWFRTGDIGEVQGDGVLKIIDRRKDLVKLQMGEYLSLGKIESEMKTCPVVDNICIFADPTKGFCVALIVPNPNKLQTIGDMKGRTDLTLEVLCQDPEITQVVFEDIQTHGRKCKLQKFEIPGAIKLCSEAEYWTPEKGLLVTAAFKLRRKNIRERYQEDIDQMYADS